MGSKFITRKRSKVKKFWGEETAKTEDFPTRVCPHCGNQAEPSEVQKDRISYRCSTCNAKNTYTRLPDGVKASKTRGSNKLGLVTLKNKGRKEKGENEMKEAVVSEEKEAVDEEEKAKLPEPETEKVGTIRSGMTKQKVLSFNYVDAKGNKSFRTVEPYKIMKDRSGAVIVYGFCLENNGIRAFKLPRIANIQEQEYDFKPRWPIEDLL